jgi:hypothetical protein
MPSATVEGSYASINTIFDPPKFSLDTIFKVILEKTFTQLLLNIEVTFKFCFVWKIEGGVFWESRTNYKIQIWTENIFRLQLLCIS